MPRVPKIWIYNGYIMGENGHNGIFIYIYTYINGIDGDYNGDMI
jgi:hypothetical protein